MDSCPCLKIRERRAGNSAQKRHVGFLERRMKFIDLFAGIGGFRRGMELAGHKCVGFCEWDKFATASYTSMHLITEEQRKYLATLDLKKRQKEILKDEYRNGEWYTSDIRNVDARSMPQADCWCFGAPCQDFSVAGKRAGLDGDRSSLVREVFRILGEIEEESRPEWLIYENVKGMFSSNRGFDYLEILLAMDELGYDCEWQLFNSKDWGVPQNRERVYTVGHLRRCGTRKILPIMGTDGENSIQQLGNYLPTKTRDNPNQGRIYFTDGIAPCLNKMDGGGREPSVVIPICNINPSGHGMNGNVYDSNGLNPTITTNKGEGNKIAITITEEDIDIKPLYNQRGIVHSVSGISRTVLGCGHSGNEPKVAIPVTLGANIIKNEIDIAHCLNANDSRKFLGKKQDGTAVCIPVLIPDRANTLNCNCNQGIFVQVSDELTVYAIWYEKYQCYIAIRKLTPKECFRLQGWTDDYFEKAQFVNSDSQLYKQAGNGVTVTVVRGIGEAIAEVERSRYAGNI